MCVVRSPATTIDERKLLEVVAKAWGIVPSDLRYAPVGGGAYHWMLECTPGGPKFLTCDDLDNKNWLGLDGDRDSIFVGLSRAYGTALSLRAAGLLFVAAPIPTLDGAPAWRLDDRHSLALFEFVSGSQGEWGEPLNGRHQPELLDAIVTLHQTAPLDSTLRSRLLEIPGREAVEEALRTLDRRWIGGPLSEAARQELADNTEVVRTLFAEFDELAEGLPRDESQAVVTHGEPHPGNVIYTDEGPALVDWDTVALAPPERDLWMIAEIDPRLLTIYEDRTGVQVNEAALRAWRLAWALTDLAAFTARLKGPHEDQTDVRRSLVGMRQIIAGFEPKPYG
jgi:spectinomycin phosphotransferase